MANVSIAAVRVLAQLAARKAVKSQLQAQGTSVPSSEIILAQADAYLRTHPKLIDEARDRAQRLGMFERRRRDAHLYQVGGERALKRLNFLVQLLRF
jgi:hypothetical protein